MRTACSGRHSPGRGEFSISVRLVCQPGLGPPTPRECAHPGSMRERSKATRSIPASFCFGPGDSPRTT